ncbi:DNA mismatch repair protein MutS [Candidatus Binatia bacterium]|nr:DNA mismatch repair protein MutS [Candidatus Binatia bacterium]
MEDPAAIYAERLAQRQATAAVLSGRERAISRARLATFVAAVGLAWIVLDAHWVSAGWLAVPVVVFVGLVVLHENVIRARQRAQRAAGFYERGVARLAGRWAGTGATGEGFADAAHPYAGDLDVFGHGSLFDLLCTARTRAGEERLANWLLAPALPNVVRARHAAVTELRPRLDLREDLAVLGSDVRVGVEPEALTAWGTAPSMLPVRWARPAALAAVTLTVLALLAWQSGSTGPLPFGVALAAEGTLGLALRRRVQRVIRAVERPTRDLALLTELLARLERESFAAPRLVELRCQLDVDGEPPSRQIARLRRRVDLLDARRNQFFAAIGPLLLWSTQCALAIEAWREKSGPAIGDWLAAIGELEALGALAAYSAEHPDDPFPEVLESGRCFHGEAVGHPLLPESVGVRNDVRLDHEVQLFIVSGSNMSGKSTLLRTVGTNTVLALAGAPVRARRLTVSPLAVGASMRVVDSLQAGASHFYAEITRLRYLLDLTAGTVPVLFLLDEILHGTNSHDRRIGAEAVVRELVARGAIGLVTTHDLALARIAEALAPHAVNVHFQDHLEDGRMVFDYRMQPGVVTKSNALGLMRAVGLRV